MPGLPMMFAEPPSELPMVLAETLPRLQMVLTKSKKESPTVLADSLLGLSPVITLDMSSDQKGV